MLKSAKIDAKANTITIVMDLEKPEPSKSGKTLVVASSRGNAKSGCMIGDKEVVIGVNAYIPM